MLAREWRAGELRVLVAALLVAVTAMTAVVFFTQRVARAVDAQGAELLAADLVLRSGRPIAGHVFEDARARGLAVTHKQSFASVVLAGDASALADVEAVADGYPLRGRVRVSDAPLTPARAVNDLPARGEAWLDANLLARLGAHVGDVVGVGELELRVTRVLVSLPDRGWGFADLAPPLLMNDADVAATGLVQPGSRVSYYALFAGAPAAVAELKQALSATLANAEELRDLDNARPELRASLTRARQFLGLATLCSSLVAGTAIALAARRHAVRHVDAVALFKCLGARRASVRAMLATQLAVLAASGGLVGTLLGYLVQSALGRLVAGAFSASLPQVAPWSGASTGVALAALLLAGFALPPLVELARVPPARILRRESGSAAPLRFLWQAAALAAVVALLVWITRDARIAAYALGGAALACALLVACGWLLLRGVQGLRTAGGAAWRYGLASLARRRAESILQLTAFGLALMFLLLLALMRGQLLDSWRARLPPDAPNYFLINIQPDERADLLDFLEQRTGRAPELVPLVRARLTAINGVRTQDLELDREGERFIRRESNLTWSQRLSESNRIVAGSWWGEAPDETQVSVEQEFADSVGIRLGDLLTYDIAGETLEARVTSMREVDWESFQPNFFMVLSPGVIERYPATFITSLYLAPAEGGVLLELVRRFPSVTPLDMNAIFAQVRGIVNRAVLAVQCVSLLALAAGVTVLLAAVQTTREERRREGAILRVFGARRGVVLRALALEFGALGLAAGLLATVVAVIVAYALARGVFDLPFLAQPIVWLAGPLAGAMLVGIAGVAATRSVLDQPPMQTLRAP
jgi:putative ABC transport system permease protein